VALVYSCYFRHDRVIPFFFVFTDRRRLEILLNVESMIPTPQDPERFSFWVKHTTIGIFPLVLNYCSMSLFLAPACYTDR